MKRSIQERTQLLANSLSTGIQLSVHRPSMDEDQSKTEELLAGMNEPRKPLRDRLMECFDCKGKKMSRQDRILMFDGNGICDILPSQHSFPKNAVNNRKYSIFSFLPMFLFDQFKQFGNLYFLLIALTQLPIPGSPFEFMWLGVWWTSIAPLMFVLFVAFTREAYDHFSRYKQDQRVNNELVTKLTNHTANNERRSMVNANGATTEQIASSKITVGDLIVLEENQRVPCDMVLLWCSNANGTTFIRTDQLDGETDWKLRKPIQCIQSQFTPQANVEELVSIQGTLKIEAPHQDIYEFMGSYSSSMEMEEEAKTNEGMSGQHQEEGLNLENTLWSSTVIASGSVVGVAVYTGKETRQALNANEAKYKIGRIDAELNWYTKLIFAIMVVLSLTLTIVSWAIYGVHSNWYVFMGRYIYLLSSIIPISLRVHMDWAKLYFAWFIEKDKEIPGTIMRTTTIPEELGRVDYLFSDKTGTLTQNEMVFKKLQLQPPLKYDTETLDLLRKHVQYGFGTYQQRVQKSEIVVLNKNEEPGTLQKSSSSSSLSSEISTVSMVSNINSPNRVRNKSNTSSNTNTSLLRKRKGASAMKQVVQIMEALALCHNVTPIVSTKGKNHDKLHIDYQASSPDEIALVKFAEECGVTLIERDDCHIRLRIDVGDAEYLYFTYEILKVFPFTSQSKRMGIIVRNTQNNDEIIFFAKGAESVMKSKLDQSEAEWMDEEVENLAREGLRTLVFSRKTLTEEVYKEFCQRYHAASAAMTNNRTELMESIRERLEQDMQLIGISGVEDKLQDEVQSTLEILKNAHIKVWMLTGDKVETAKVIARSSRLVAYGQEFFSLIAKNPRDAIHRLDLLGGNANHADVAIVIDGPSLDVYLKYCRKEFIENAVEASVVICCRCSPTQKAEMVELVHEHTNKICAAIGDGGNDVAMIQKANIGVGILGKEGKQASLAADVSVNKFEYISRLFLWHGRLSYKNTAKMAQFIIHRGSIIAFIQCLFSIIFYFSAIPLFTGPVAIGYVCVYTVLPVMILVLDADITSHVALYYPELYHDLQKGTSLNSKTMLSWCMRSVFQAAAIMGSSMWLFESEFHNFMTITFTALVITEIFNIVVEVKRWHYLMVIAEIFSLLIYYVSIYIPIPMMQTHFDSHFTESEKFWFKSILTGLVSVAPMAIFKLLSKKLNPAAHAKLKEHEANYKTPKLQY